MTSRDSEGQGRDPNIFHARYFDISKTARFRDLVTMGHPIGNGMRGIEWSRDR